RDERDGVRADAAAAEGDAPGDLRAPRRAGHGSAAADAARRARSGGAGGHRRGPASRRLGRGAVGWYSDRSAVLPPPNRPEWRAVEVLHSDRDDHGDDAGAGG